MSNEHLHCLATGSLTGYDFVFNIREEFGGNSNNFAGAEDIGVIDAPERTAGGSCVRVDDNPVINGMQSQVWR